MKLCEANALAVQVVKIGCLDDGVTVSGYVAIALIIRKDENDIGPSRSLSS
jgi:hypothetical protein